MKWTVRGHQFDSLGNIFKKRSSILVYAASNPGVELVRKYKFLGIFVGFIDRDCNKQKKGVVDLPVYSPDILFEKHDETHLILVCFKAEFDNKNICARLRRAGYRQNVDFFLYRDFLGNMGVDSYYLSLYAFYAKNKLILPSTCTIPSTVCNLNCRHCLNFTPYMKNFDVRDLSDVCADIDVLFHSIDYTFRFQISGGEPLLYKAFAELVDYIGGNYRHQIDVFETVLNGTIVPDNKTCETIKRNQMQVYLDNYVEEIPQHMNRREEIIAKLESYGITWIDNTVPEWFCLDIDHTDFSGLTEKSLSEWFDICANPWHCYENGKIYACNFSRFAVKAGLQDEDDNDYFDLKNLQEKDRASFLEFTLGYNSRGYARLCSHCSGWADVNPKRVNVAEQATGKLINPFRC